MSDQELKNVGLNANVRPESLDILGLQSSLFPFDAFEFDDPNRVLEPHLKMKAPWVFEADRVTVGSITLKDLTQNMQDDLEETRLIAEDNQSKIAMQDGSVLIQGEQIELRTVALNEEGEPVKGGSIKLGLDEAGGYTEVVGTLRSTNFDRDAPFEDREGWRITEDGDAEFNTSTIRVGSNSEGKQVLGDALVIENDELTLKTGRINFKSPNYTTETSAIEYEADPSSDYEGFKIGDFDNPIYSDNFGIQTNSRGTTSLKGWRVEVKADFNSRLPSDPDPTYQTLAGYIDTNLLYSAGGSRNSRANQAILTGFGDFSVTSGRLTSFGLLVPYITGYYFQAFWGTSFAISLLDTSILPIDRRVLFY